MSPEYKTGIIAIILNKRDMFYYNSIFPGVNQKNFFKLQRLFSKDVGASLEDLTEECMILGEDRDFAV